ncbi:protein FAM221B [Nycticebus coucang]|uniref:protein FAM221B n=1 Tax=Nycticebus coucang TaxID=9470 RepID=UPI00234CF75B|nr:protein FAM221B [Nycticebus coucang]
MSPSQPPPTAPQMEADKVTEEPHTTMDIEEHPASKDPSAEDLQKDPISEAFLEPSISETPLESHTSESPLAPSSSQSPLETHTSESPLAPSSSQSPLETHASESTLMPSPPRAPLKTHTSESPSVPSSSQSPLETHISETTLVSPPQAPLETHISESPLTPSPFQTPLETHTSESPLIPSPSQTPLEIHASESPFVPSLSQTPLETYTPETHLQLSNSETTLGHSTYEIPLETSTSESPLDSHIAAKHLNFHLSSLGHVSVSSSDGLVEDLSYGYTKVPESDSLPGDSLSGPSTQVQMDMSAKQKEEGREDEEEVDASASTAHTAHPGHQPGKKGKKGVSRFTGHPVVPAQQAELVGVAKAMHREKFDAQVNYLFQWEKNAALNAIQTGLYIGWRCPHYLWDCFRIGDESKCFCGHLLREHRIISDISVPCNVSQCRCLMFCFIPSRPEEVGEFWLKRRATFDPKAWRAQCRCKHSHEEHAATGSHPCRHRDCCCRYFESNFLCAACDRRWEEHVTFFETEETRRRGGRPHGTDTVNNWRRPV